MIDRAQEEFARDVDDGGRRGLPPPTGDRLSSVRVRSRSKPLEIETRAAEDVVARCSLLETSQSPVRIDGRHGICSGIVFSVIFRPNCSSVGAGRTPPFPGAYGRPSTSQSANSAADVRTGPRTIVFKGRHPVSTSDRSPGDVGSIGRCRTPSKNRRRTPSCPPPLAADVKSPDLGSASGGGATSYRSVGMLDERQGRVPFQAACVDLLALPSFCQLTPAVLTPLSFVRVEGPNSIPDCFASRSNESTRSPAGNID